MVLDVDLAAFALEDDDQLLIDRDLSTLVIIGLLLAASTATGVLTREIDNTSVLTVVSKRVPRAALVTGKSSGVAGAITLASWVLALVCLPAVRHRVQTRVRMDETFDLPVLVFSLLCGGGATPVAAAANDPYRGPFPGTFAVCLAIGLATSTDRLAYGARMPTDMRQRSPHTPLEERYLAESGRPARPVRARRLQPGEPLHRPHGRGAGQSGGTVLSAP